MNRPFQTQSLMRAVQDAMQEKSISINQGREAMEILAALTVNRDKIEAYIVRTFLLSLYNGNNPTVNLSDLNRLHWTLRKLLCQVMLAVHSPNFPSEDIRLAYEKAGDPGARWFLSGITDPLL